MRSVCTVLILLISVSVFAQKGILPFTGLTYEYKGLRAESIEVDLAENTWTSNRLPVDTDFEIRLVNPEGFATVDGIYMPGIEVAMLNLKGDTLGYIENMLGGDDFTGYEEFTLKKLKLSLGFNEYSKPGDTIIIYARFFDTNSDNELITGMTVVIADSKLPLETTNSTFGVGGDLGYDGMASGIELSRVGTGIVEAVGFNTPYEAIRIDSLVGLTEKEWKKGKLEVSCYTSGMESHLLKNTVYRTTVLPASKNSVNLNFEVPFAVDGMKFIRIRWENADHSKVMDLVVDTEI